MTEPASPTLAYLRRIDEKLDRIEGRMDGVEGRLDRRAGATTSAASCSCSTASRSAWKGGRSRNGLKATFDRHERWLGELGRRVTELGGAEKESPPASGARRERRAETGLRG
jgi:hypothetical protein